MSSVCLLVCIGYVSSYLALLQACTHLSLCCLFFLFVFGTPFLILSLWSLFLLVCFWHPLSFPCSRPGSCSLFLYLCYSVCPCSLFLFIFIFAFFLFLCFYLSLSLFSLHLYSLLLCFPCLFFLFPLYFSISLSPVFCSFLCAVFSPTELLSCVCPLYKFLAPPIFRSNFSGCVLIPIYNVFRVFNMLFLAFIQ